MINGGTNNANDNIEVNLAREQMDGILQDIWNYDDMADTCIILSTLLPTENEVGAVNRIAINGVFRKMVKAYSGDKCIYLADMEPTGDGKDFMSLDGPYWSDNPKVHPNVSLQSLFLCTRGWFADNEDRTKGTRGWPTCFTPLSTGP